ncbi:hypothetical protein SPRG_05066 [Saprolegnia parasitica CBS 223.65]|uniref:Uncharacterized protein n=1 Tax=Saprolegnia parasitica (strain CBS 223.65) TaxID=695850 RepID=A0A067CMA2_SAPPC|nr:hypothetical protein SPRG_05066 [Saprolegnia parasitica CBS 223.65]KDO30355.1 hypothetical protein SPRG_05066 [Saprolegnia parasitica CBS 223.65]|eukprot:XP_012198965.1 hypothetical protein SPRG_05066 [Saprolegnia parasitica CBS 223.65]
MVTDGLAQHKREAIVRKVLIGLCAWIACAAMTPFKDGPSDKFAGGMGCMALFFSIMDLPYHARFKRIVSGFAGAALVAAGVWVLTSTDCRGDLCSYAYVAVAFLFVTALLEGLAWHLVCPNLVMAADDDLSRKRAEIFLCYLLRVDRILLSLYLAAAIVVVVTVSLNASATFVLAAFLQLLQLTSTWIQLRSVRKSLSIEATFVEAP